MTRVKLKLVDAYNPTITSFSYRSLSERAQVAYKAVLRHSRANAG